MKARIVSLFGIASVALAAALPMGQALAHDDVRWSVSVGVPAYTQTYVQPAPPQVVYVNRAPVYYRNDGWGDREWREHEWREHERLEHERREWWREHEMHERREHERQEWYEHYRRGNDWR